MDGWWMEIDGQVRACLERHGALAPAGIARLLGLSEGAVTRGRAAHLACRAPAPR